MPEGKEIFAKLFAKFSRVVLASACFNKERFLN